MDVKAVVIGVWAVYATAAHAAEHGIGKRLDGNGFCKSPAAAHDFDAQSFCAEPTAPQLCNLNSTNAEDFVLCVDLHAHMPAKTRADKWRAEHPN
jgi:hypothetical protein